MTATERAALPESTGLKWAVVGALLATIVVNTLANTIRIGGYTTGEVSALYPTLFTPSGLTFSIWGVIYILLTFYAIYQFAKVRGLAKSTISEGLYFSLSPLIILSSIVNIAWIFSFHFQWIGVSTVLIAVLFAILLVINWRIKVETANGQTWLDYLCVTLPFVAYVGWITVANVANVMAWLTSIAWPPAMENAPLITAAAILVGLLMGAGLCWWLKDGFYGLVLIWAFAGILLKHLDVNGFNGQYPLLIGLLGVVLIALLALTVFVTIRRFRPAPAPAELN